MDARLSLLLLFFKSPLLVLGASVKQGLHQRCPPIATIKEIDERATITTLKKGTQNKEGDLYVHPDSGFTGVNLVVAGDDGWREEASFTLNNTCFRQKAEWWMLNALIMRDWVIYDNNDDLAFRVLIGDCYLVCRRRGRFRGAMTVYVNSHGPSRWRLNHPTPCSVTDLSSPPRHATGTCSNTPTTTTTVKTTTEKNPTTTATTTTTVEATTENNPTTTTTTITTPTTITTATPTITRTAIIITTVVLVMIGVVVVVLVVRKRVRQRRQQSTEDVKRRSQGAPPPTESVVVENSLYEPVENTGGRVVVENSLYEPVENTSGRVVVENSLYEPVESTGGRAVVENSLYEPFENFRKPL